MGWITPKTNWVDGEYFNLDPDYNRIKGNIEYLIALSEEMYSKYTDIELESADITGFPRVAFFNNVVNATNSILSHCFSPVGSKAMRVYSSNGVGWNATELNAIENNHLLLYQALMGQKSVIPHLQITLGGVRLGN
jgi:hypothetical protein